MAVVNVRLVGVQEIRIGAQTGEPPTPTVVTGHMLGLEVTDLSGYAQRVDVPLFDQAAWPEFTELGVAYEMTLTPKP